MRHEQARRTDDSDLNFSPILAALFEIYRKYRDNFSGQVATYIPELAKVNPALFGIALATADGEIYEVGDARQLFTIQSISKPFVYALALEDNGVEQVLQKIGVEPSGEAFNSIVFDERSNRPFNPMVNAGAIAATALIKGANHEQRLNRLLGKFSDLCGRAIQIDHAVYRSERATGHRNRAIGFLALNAGMIAEPIDDHLDLYFEQCSILVSARDLAVMAATVANNGVNPLTGVRAIETRYIKYVLSVMHSCGMYDYSGEWSYRIGLPAKSGVGGGIIAALPGQLGIGTYSPLLDDQGNSCRGIQVCQDISERFKLHMFSIRSTTAVTVRSTYRGDTMRSKLLRGKTEQEILNRRGAAICVYELQGNLFFATMERLLRQLDADIATASYLIFDFKRVLEMDDCARALMEQLNGTLAAQGKKLILAHLAKAESKRWHADPANGWGAESFFPDNDSALEWCETQLIIEENPPSVRANVPLPLAAMDIVANLEAREILLLESVLVTRTYGATEKIIREGESADSLFLLAAGSVSVYLNLEHGDRAKRLSSLSPGLAFGELSLLDGRVRSADVVAADESVVCYVLSIEKLNALAIDRPEIKHKLIFNIARELSTRLRRADAEIRALAE
jgi:glutaminase